MALTLLSGLWTVLLAFGMVFAVLTGVAVAHLIATAAVLAAGWAAADAVLLCLRAFGAWRGRSANRNSCAEAATGACAAAWTGLPPHCGVASGAPAARTGTEPAANV